MTYIHPNDRVYALERALAAAVAQGEGCKPDTALMIARRSAMAEPTIRSGLVEQGRSNLKYHALRADGTAACSSYIPVVSQPFSAASIPPVDRCNSPACRKLFATADQEHAEAFAHG